MNGLHADEQHHLSRLTVRLVELEQPLEELHAGSGAAPTADEWERAARAREIAEIERYEALLRLDLDVETADLIRSILDAERRHATELGGKWMEA